MSVVHRENDSTSLVLATAQAVLNSAAAFATAGGFPGHDCNNVEKDGVASVVDMAISDESSDMAVLCSRLGDQLRVNALDIEEQLRTVGHSFSFSVVGVSGGYGFTRALHLGKQGQVNCIVGAFAGDADDPIMFDPESPLVLEILAGNAQRSLADRVRILSQLVCLYSDAIRFGGFRNCPLGDAIRLLRLAISEMRETEPDSSGDHADDAGYD